jgi:hypothetical protein
MLAAAAVFCNSTIESMNEGYFHGFSDAVRLPQSNNVGCGLLDDPEAIKLQLRDNAAFPALGLPSG